MPRSSLDRRLSDGNVTDAVDRAARIRRLTTPLSAAAAGILLALMFGAA